MKLVVVNCYRKTGDGKLSKLWAVCSISSKKQKWSRELDGGWGGIQARGERVKQDSQLEKHVVKQEKCDRGLYSH